MFEPAVRHSQWFQHVQEGVQIRVQRGIPRRISVISQGVLYGHRRIGRQATCSIVQDATSKHWSVMYQDNLEAKKHSANQAYRRYEALWPAVTRKEAPKKPHRITVMRSTCRPGRIPSLGKTEGIAGDYPRTTKMGCGDARQPTTSGKQEQARATGREDHERDGQSRGVSRARLWRRGLTRS